MTYMMPFSTTAARWAAVSSRDRQADTYFVYGVRTTKIFCRPICPGRLARRANMEYFDSPSEALAAGYRACKRCKPETVASFESVDEQGRRRKEGIQRAVALMEAKNGVISLEEAANEAGIGGKWHFLRVFKEVMGETPGAMMVRLRNEASGNSASITTPSSSSAGPTSTTDGSYQDPQSETSFDPFESAWLAADDTEMERYFEQIMAADLNLESQDGVAFASDASPSEPWEHDVTLADSSYGHCQWPIEPTAAFDPLALELPGYEGEA